MTGVRNRYYDVLWRGSRCQQCPRVKEEGSRWSFALTLWPSVGLFSGYWTAWIPHWETVKKMHCHTVVENNRQLHTWVVLFLGVTDVSVTFCIVAVVWMDRDGLSDTWQPRNLKLWTISTQSLLLKMGEWSGLHFLQSRIASFVFFVFNARLFAGHQWATFGTLSRYVLPKMRPNTVSSTIFIMELEVWEDIRMHVMCVMWASNGLST